MTLPPPEGVPGEIVYLRLPRPAECFASRARRFRELAPGNPMSEFLEALGTLSEAQSRAVARIDASPQSRALPSEVPLRATSWSRDADWRAALEALLGDLRRSSWPPEAAAALERLARATPEELEPLADGILSGAPADADLARSPFVAAALQVYFTALAARLPAELVARAPAGCPVCGSPPVAGVVRGDDKLRYLTCSLCGSEWNLPRVQCWHCRATGGISYLSLDSGSAGLKAEACSSCGAYLKLFYLEAVPGADPTADDVASLTLDLVAAEQGWARSGVNLFLLGASEG